MSEPEGILIVDKPVGWTSHDVVNKTRRLLGGTKVGHAGTLDPMATGILVLLIGGYTKKAVDFQEHNKRYKAKILFGKSTDTYDSTGETVEECDIKEIDLKKVESAISNFNGEMDQVPPMYSAVKVKGKPLYKYARKGMEIDRKPRKISVKVLSYDFYDFPVVNIEIECSKGTYIRSIAHEIGKISGYPSHLFELRRTLSGKYSENDAENFLSLVESGSKEKILNLLKK